MADADPETNADIDAKTKTEAETEKSGSSSSAKNAENKAAVRQSFLVIVGGQLERVLGTVTSVLIRKWIGPAEMGVYSGLRIYLDNTNRSSVGISLGAAQEVPILRAAGKPDEAERLANVAFTVNSLSSLVYVAALLAYVVWRRPQIEGEPFAELWTWGLVAMAACAPIKRYHDFLIVMMRCHQQFGLITSLDVLDAVVYAVMLLVLLWMWGFAGLLVSIALLMLFNIAYLHKLHPLRFRFAWDWKTIWRLFKVGLPIWINTLLFTWVGLVDRIAILWLDPNPEYSAGLYSIAIMGTSWALDLAGRIVLVMYTYFQTTLGRTRNPKEVAFQAVRATEAQLPLLCAGSAVAYLAGPVFLGTIMAEYAGGLPALRPLLPAMIFTGLTLGARQALITVDRPWRLGLATLLGLIVSIDGVIIGEANAGIVGVAWGTSAGALVLYLATTIAAYVPWLGWSGWIKHQLRLCRLAAWYVLGAGLAAHLPLGIGNYWLDFAARCAILLVWGLPALWIWAVGHGWGGLLDWLPAFRQRQRERGGEK